MAHIIFSNNANTTLAGALTNVATTAQLAAGTGALMPQPTGDQYFKLTFTDAATGSQREIVHCTNVSGDTLTIVRAQEGTSARPWLAGDFADHMITAGSMTPFLQIVDLPFIPSFPLAVPNGGTGVTAFNANAVLIGAGASPITWANPSGTLPLLGTGGLPAFGQLQLNAASAGGASVNVIGSLPPANSAVNVISVYPTPGVFTHTVPANLYWEYFELVAGGGGGAGENTGGPFTGGGGGAGGYAAGWIATTPGAGITVTVGTGGTGGTVSAGAANGTNGGSTSFGAFGSATGGTGGQSGANAAGGDGGVGTISGQGITQYGGYGGDGDIALTGAFAGNGGASFFGGGLRAARGGPVATPAAAGSGGGGGYIAGNGSNGMPGMVIVRG